MTQHQPLLKKILKQTQELSEWQGQLVDDLKDVVTALDSSDLGMNNHDGRSSHGHASVRSYGTHQDSPSLTSVGWRAGATPNIVNESLVTNESSHLP